MLILKDSEFIVNKLYHSKLVWHSLAQNYQSRHKCFGHENSQGKIQTDSVIADQENATLQARKK